MTIQSVSATGDFTMNATADTLIGGMTLTPPAGDYLALFTMHLDALATAKAIEISIYVGGAILQHPERRIDIEGSIAAAGVLVVAATNAKVTVNGREWTVIRSIPRNGGSLPTPAHLEVTLT